MKKPTLTIHPRPNRDKTKLYLGIRYTYNRSKYDFPINQTLNAKDWDAKKERVQLRHSESAELNGKLGNELNRLERIISNLMKQGVEPVYEIVKAHYSSSVENERIWNETNEKARPTNLARAAEHRTEIEKLQEQIRVLEAKERKNLRWANVGLLNVGQLKVPTEPENVPPPMVQLLEEYILAKTKLPLSVKRKVNEAFTGTERQLRTWANTFLSFTKSPEFRNAKLALDFTGLNQDFYDAYASFLLNPNTYDLYNNTFGQHVKKLKTFLKWAEVDKLQPVDKRYTRFKVLAEEKEIICFNKREIDLLHSYTPKARAHSDSIEYQKFIDFTVFSFLTGLRISDVKKAGGFRLNEGYLMGKTTKTKNQFKIPLELDERIIQILEKYQFDMALFSDVEYNRQIKVILKDFLEESGLHQKPIKITRYKLDKAITETFSFAELYSSHCNRRGFVSYAYSLGFNLSEVMEIIGTKSEKEVKKYLKTESGHLTEKLRKLKQQA